MLSAHRTSWKAEEDGITYCEAAALEGTHKCCPTGLMGRRLTKGLGLERTFNSFAVHWACELSVLPFQIADVIAIYMCVIPHANATHMVSQNSHTNAIPTLYAHPRTHCASIICPTVVPSFDCVIESFRSTSSNAAESAASSSSCT